MQCLEKNVNPLTGKELGDTASFDLVWYSERRASMRQ